MKIVQLDGLAQEEVSHNPAIKKRVMLGPGDVPGVTNFSQARFEPGHVAPAHEHADMHEVFLIEAGRGVIRVDAQEHSLEPGVCVAVKPGERHELANTGQEDLVVTYFGVKG